MSDLFGKLVRTVVNVTLLPVAVARDAVSLAGAIDNDGRPHTADALQRIKDEASDAGGNDGE